MTGIFVLCLVFILNHKEAEQLKTVTSIITIIIMVIISLLFIPIFGLTGFHIVLGKEDQRLYKKYKNNHKPFIQLREGEPQTNK